MIRGLILSIISSDKIYIPIYKYYETKYKLTNRWHLDLEKHQKWQKKV